MNEYIITASFIAAILIAGFLLLVNFGVTIVTYFGIGLVAVSIAGGVIYTWWKTAKDKTIEKLKLETLSKMREEFNKTSNYVNEAAELVDVKDIREGLGDLREGFIKLGLFDEKFESIAKGIGKHTLTFIEQQTRKGEQRLRSLETLTAGTYKPELDKYAQGLHIRLMKLYESGYPLENGLKDFEVVQNRIPKSLIEMIEKKKTISNLFSAMLAKCYGEAEALLNLAGTYGDVGRAEGDIRMAKERAGDIDAYVSLLASARNRLKEILGPAFIKRRSILLSSLQRTMELLGDDIDGFKGSIEEILSKVSSTTDPGRLEELMGLENNFKNNLVSLLAKLNGDLLRIDSEITAFGPTKDLWTRDEGIGMLIEKVDPSMEIPAFTEEAIMALGRAVNQYRNDIMSKKVVENFGKMEPIIERKLKEHGRLSGADLRVKYAEKFLQYYSTKHPEVEFREKPPVLLARSHVLGRTRVEGGP